MEMYEVRMKKFIVKLAISVNSSDAQSALGIVQNCLEQSGFEILDWSIQGQTPTESEG